MPALLSNLSAGAATSDIFANVTVSTSFVYGSADNTDKIFYINSSAGFNTAIGWQKSGLTRFTMGLSPDAQANFNLWYFDNSGNYVGGVYYVDRSSGLMYMNNSPVVGDSSQAVATTAFVSNAVDGMTSIATSGGTTTLSQTQYAAAVVTATGTLTSNAVFVVPNSGVMTVVNKTSGAFTLTIKTASGTGTTVIQGTARNLFADGTNVIPAQSDFSNGQFSTMTGTTSLTVPQVKTTNAQLQLASAKGVQLQVEDDGFIRLMLNGSAPAANGQYVRLAYDSQNYWQNTYGSTLLMQSANGITFASQGQTILNLPNGVGSSSVNYTQIDNATTTNSPVISAKGSDTNITLALAGKGTGAINVTSAFSISGYEYRSGATGLSAAGTTQGTATAISKTNSVFTTVASGAGATLPNLAPVNGAFAEFTVVNAGANALLLYPASGNTINALAANAALSVAAGTIARGIQLSTTAYRFG